MFIRLVFTSDGVAVGVGVVIKSVEVYDLAWSSEKSVLIPLTTPSFTMKWKMGRRSRKQKRKNLTNHSIWKYFHTLDLVTMDMCSRLRAELLYYSIITTVKADIFHFVLVKFTYSL